MQDYIVFLQNHLILASSFGLLLLLILVIEGLRYKHANLHITPSLLTDMINHKNAVVVDLRQTDEFNKGHILGALSLPMAEFGKESKKLEKMINRPLILVCGKGHEAPKVARELKGKGFQAYVLKGGIQAWVGAQLPLSKKT